MLVVKRPKSLPRMPLLSMRHSLIILSMYAHKLQKILELLSSFSLKQRITSNMKTYDGYDNDGNLFISKRQISYFFAKRVKLLKVYLAFQLLT